MWQRIGMANKAINYERTREKPTSKQRARRILSEEKWDEEFAMRVALGVDSTDSSRSPKTPTVVSTPEAMDWGRARDGEMGALQREQS
jgi:hypothetical protein